jgi:hypothetical protein
LQWSLCAFSAKAMRNVGTTSGYYSIDKDTSRDTVSHAHFPEMATSCVQAADDDCINLILQLILDRSRNQLKSPLQFANASKYSMNCGPLIDVGTPVCISG